MNAKTGNDTGPDTHEPRNDDLTYHAPDLDEISDGDVLLTDGLLRYVVSVAIRAPSIHNSQPWRFHASADVPDTVDLLADRSRQLSVLDPVGRQLHISAGAALHHAVLALHGIGRRVRITLLPDPDDPDHLARIVTYRSTERPNPDEWALLYATRERRTHRQHFRPDRLPKPLLVDLVTAAERQGVHLRYVEAPGERRAIADLIAEATRRQEADPDYQRELAAWVGRPADSADGVPLEAAAPPRHAVARDEFEQRDFDPHGGSLWTPDAPGEHPDVVLVWSEGDTRHDWIRTGAALSSVLLTATCAGVGASLLNQPLEFPALRERVRAELRIPGSPQLLLRIGFSRTAAFTRRRPLDDVLEVTPDPGVPE